MSEKNKKTRLFSVSLANAKTEYFRWLCDQVNIGNHNGRTFYTLALILNFKMFCPLDENDINRVEDGKKLREQWIELFNKTRNLLESFDESRAYYIELTPDTFGGQISILELLVSLAIRIEEDIMQDDDKGDRTAFWFWKMLENLTLHTYSDDSITNDTECNIHEILDRFLEQDYDDDGNGSLFPTPGFKKIPHKNVEIWKQLNAWLNYSYRED